MQALTMMVWSMALGAIAAVAIARIADFVARPSRSQLRAVYYHLAVFVLVLVLSGVPRAAGTPGEALLEALQVLAGPLCVALSNHWLQGWLQARQRDLLMASVLRVSALVLPLLAGAALALPPELRLPAASALALAGSTLTCWLTFRAWRAGDRLALVMAGGCLLTLPAIYGLYAIAMQPWRWGLTAQAAVALCAALSNGLTGTGLWQRERHEWRTRDTGSVPLVDPVTRLHSSTALVHRLVDSQKRRARSRRQGAVLAITVFDPERIAVLVGPAGLNEVWMTVAARIQRQVGVVNPVGRYWDRCFVALVESIPTASWLRTVGLRVASSLRRPIEVTGRDGEPVRVRIEVGVGLVHLATARAEAEDVLADAQGLAEAARQMPSRTAMTDQATGRVVAVEEATFARASARPGAAVLPLQRRAR